MYLSYRWLNDYVDLSGFSIEELCEKIRIHSCEVDDWREHYAHLDGLKWAKISSVSRHPHADRLALCKVQVYSGSIAKGKLLPENQEDTEIQIVCGATNVRVGMFSILAPVGTKIANGMLIKATKIRNIKSEGMLCSWGEIGLSSLQREYDSDDQNELMIIDIPIAEIETEMLRKKGIDYWKIKKSKKPARFEPAHYFDARDFVIEVDNKSITHRPDLWSHFGFARELAAIFDLPLKEDPLREPRSIPAAGKINSTIGKNKSAGKKITYEKDTVLAYFAADFSDLQIVPSPLWLQIRLLLLGHKPINNAIDASNYILYDIGQPCHAFSHNKIDEDTIHVGIEKKSPVLAASSSKKSKVYFQTLDAVTRHIPANTMMIYAKSAKKQKRAIAIAGVMGGNETAISSESQRIFFESATFMRKRIRQSMTALNLRTDASRAFEKGQDPFQAKPAIFRFYHLMSLTSPHIKMSEIHGFANITKNRITCCLSFIQKKLGIEIDAQQVQSILERLQISVVVKQVKKETEFILQIPSFRSQYDLTIAEDIVEEIGRMVGYSQVMRGKKLKKDAAHTRLRSHQLNIERRNQNQIKTFFAEVGRYREVYNYSFTSQINNELFCNEPAIEIRNPVDQNQRYLKTQLFSGLIENVKTNRNAYDQLRLFEFARTYHFWDTENKSPEQGKKASVTPCQEIKRVAWLDYTAASLNASDEEIEQALIQMRLFLNSFFRKYSIDVRYKRIENQLYYHPKAAVTVHLANGLQLASYGILHPQIRQEFDLQESILLLGEMNVSRLFLSQYVEDMEKQEGQFYFSDIAVKPIHSDYHTPSVYPPLSFEIALIMPKELGSEVPLQIIRSLGIKEIQKVIFLDSYQASPLPADKKSVSYRIICLSSDKTMSTKDMQKIIEKIQTACREESLILRDNASN